MPTSICANRPPVKAFSYQIFNRHLSKKLEASNPLGNAYALAWGRGLGGGSKQKMERGMPAPAPIQNIKRLFFSFRPLGLSLGRILV